MIFHYKGIVNSTNIWAKKISDTKYMHILYAGYQTAGRGRKTRQWVASPEKNILMSIVYSHINKSVEPWIYGIYAAYSVIQLLTLHNIEAYYKWPNDVWTRKGKICGILPEAIWNSDSIEHIIVGIGLNVNEENFSRNLKASSMLLETGQTYNIHDLVRKLSYLYKSSLEKPKDTIFTFLWNKFIWKEEKIIALPDNIEGVAIGIGPSGELLVETSGKKITPLKWGEISLRKTM